MRYWVRPRTEISTVCQLCAGSLVWSIEYVFSTYILDISISPYACFRLSKPVVPLPPGVCPSFQQADLLASMTDRLPSSRPFPFLHVVMILPKVPYMSSTHLIIYHSQPFRFKARSFYSSRWPQTSPVSGAPNRDRPVCRNLGWN